MDDLEYLLGEFAKELYRLEDTKMSKDDYDLTKEAIIHLYALRIEEYYQTLHISV